MKATDFIVGQDYRYSQLPEEDTEELTVTEVGPDLLGASAIHVRFHENEPIDVWFIYDGYANEGIFKCVYNK